MNTRAVGNNISALVAAGQLSSDLSSILNEFVGQSFSSINAALDQMHPAPFSAFHEIQEELNSTIVSLFHRYPYIPRSCEMANRFWARPFGNSLTQKQHGIQLEFTGNSGGLAVGYDTEVADYVVVGVGGAWSDTTVHWEHHRLRAKVTGLYGSLYADWQVRNFFFGTALLAGADLLHTSRHLEFFTTNRTASAHFTAIDIVGQIQSAYFYGLQAGALFYPYANFNLLYLHTPQFKEHGADGLNLTVKNRSDLTLRSELGLGLQVQDVNWDETICISPSFSIGWVNMAPLKRENFTSTFQGADISFTTFGWDETWNLLELDFGLSVRFPTAAIGLYYNLEFVPSDKELFDQSANIRLDFYM